jgi:hypothetical protein
MRSLPLIEKITTNPGAMSRDCQVMSIAPCSSKRTDNAMKTKLLERCIIVTSLAVMSWLSVPPTQAAVQVLRTDIALQEVTNGVADTQPFLPSDAPVVKVPSGELIWVDDIMNALRLYFTTNYPAANFSSYLKRLTVMRDAVDRGDRRTVKVEMGTFFTMLANRNDGLSKGAAEELRNFARVVMPAQEYGLIFPSSGIEAYGTIAQRGEWGQ